MSICLWCRQVEVEGHDLCIECRNTLREISIAIGEDKDVLKAYYQLIYVLVDKGYFEYEEQRAKHARNEYEIKPERKKSLSVK